MENTTVDVPATGTSQKKSTADLTGNRQLKESRLCDECGCVTWFINGECRNFRNHGDPTLIAPAIVCF